MTEMLFETARLAVRKLDLADVKAMAGVYGDKNALNRDAWAQGYATEAAMGMLGYIAETFGKTRVIATIDPENGASRRVLEKAGMRFLKTIEEDGSTTEVLEWRARETAY